MGVKCPILLGLLPLRAPLLELLPGRLIKGSRDPAGDMRMMDSIEGPLDRGEIDRGRFLAECRGLVTGEKPEKSPNSTRRRSGVRRWSGVMGGSFTPAADFGW
jgi:hypothetical protein